VVLAKTIGVLLLIGVILWLFFSIVGLLAFAVWTLIKFVLIALIIAAVYHYFKHQKAT
jgi:hypothetical protein